MKILIQISMTLALFSSCNEKKRQIEKIDFVTSYKYQRGQAWADLAIFHPDTHYEKGRPNWLFGNGNLQVKINLHLIDMAYPVLVMAYLKGEDINKAIPIDLFEVKQRTDDCMLGLKKGEYVIVVTNGEESLKFEKEVKR